MLFVSVILKNRPYLLVMSNSLMCYGLHNAYHHVPCQARPFDWHFSFTHIVCNDVCFSIYRLLKYTATIPPMLTIFTCWQAGSQAGVLSCGRVRGWGIPSVSQLLPSETYIPPSANYLVVSDLVKWNWLLSAVCCGAATGDTHSPSWTPFCS